MSKHKPKSALDYNYSVDTTQGLNWRLASFLNWAAEELPGRAIPYQQVAKIVLVKPRMPTADGPEVRQIKSASGRARRILLTQYKRGLVSIPGMGIRATVDADDTVVNQVESDARRTAAAVEALERSTAAVTSSEIHDAAVKRRFSKLTKATRTLTAPDVFQSLRLPQPKKK